MFRHYLKITIRSLRKYKGYTFLNLFGLTIGMTCAILIGLYIQDELSYDRYVDQADRLFRVVYDNKAKTPSALGPILQRESPEIIDYVRLRPPSGSWLMKHEANSFYEKRVFYADASLFNLFSWPFVVGDPKTALQAPRTVVITASTARKYFGDDDPLGKIIVADNGWADLQVTGVIQDLPQNTHFKADFFISLTTLTFFQEDSHAFAPSWQDQSYYTYFLANSEDSLNSLTQKWSDILEPHAPKENYDIEKLSVQPLTSIHLHSHLTQELEANSHITYIYILTSIAGFILLIACINFINLSTARSSHRAREIGLRKVVGAQRRQLIWQFLGESGALCMIAALLAAGLVQLMLPVFNELTSKTIALADLYTMPLLLGLISMVLIVGFASGSYPALFLSSFQPVSILKGTLTNRSGKTWLRKGLVIGQFTMAILLLISTGLLYQQLNFMQNKRLGLNPEQVLLLPPGMNDVANQYDPLKRDLLQDPRIRSVTRSLTMPGQTVTANTGATEKVRRTNGLQSNPIEILGLWVNYDFPKTLGLDLLAGRDFSPDYSTDYGGEAVILNETAVQQLGWPTPEEAIGKRIQRDDRSSLVIGVVKDFHIQSLHHHIDPLLLKLEGSFWVSHVAIRIQPDNLLQTLAFIESCWQTHLPNYPFDVTFLSNDFAQFYRQEEHLGRVIGVFTGMAILTACLGLFGLASFTAEHRTREIGIRKILGASIPNLIRLLTKEFLILIVAANVIAWPLAYWIMSAWLQNFAYRIDIDLWIFFLAALLALGIALLTVSYQAIRAALANPVDSLRYE